MRYLVQLVENHACQALIDVSQAAEFLTFFKPRDAMLTIIPHPYGMELAQAIEVTNSVLNWMVTTSGWFNPSVYRGIQYPRFSDFGENIAPYWMFCESGDCMSNDIADMIAELRHFDERVALHYDQLISEQRLAMMQDTYLHFCLCSDHSN